MKDKFKQTSFFSTVKRKLDIFKWQSKKPNREEPILLGIKSTSRTNCEVSNDFEYFNPRRQDNPDPCINIYSSVQSINQDHIYNSAENISDVVIKPIIKKKPVNYIKHRNINNNNNINHYDSFSRKSKSKVKEIEIFEKKFLTPLSNTRSKSTTTIVIKDDATSEIRNNKVSRSKMIASSSSPRHHQRQHSQQHVRVLRTSSKDSDCDSGAYSRSSSPEPIYERLDRSCEKLEEKFPLQSPNLVLSVIKENHTAKVNSNLVLSCLNEAGKSSLFCSLDSLNQISTQPRFFKKNPALRKLSADPSVSVAVGNKTQLSIGLKNCSKSETELNKIVDKELFNSIQRSQKKYLKAKKSLESSLSSLQRIKVCTCQVTVNGQHICNLITQPK